VARLTVAFILLGAVGGCGYGPAYAVSPLAAASRTGDLAGIDRLLAAGADINAGSGVNDWPPVIHAIHKHQLAALGHLLDRGAAVNASLRSRGLSVARGSGDEDAVLAILNAHRQTAVAAKVP